MRFPVIGLLVVGLLLSAPVLADEGQVLLFDPDGSYGNLQELTSYFQKFLDKQSPGWTFQAVRQRSVFEDLVKQPGKRLAIVSSEYLRSGGTGKLTPLLVPAVGDDYYYRKLLVDNGTGDKKALADKSIAVTNVNGAASPQARALVAELGSLGATNASLVNVPKDVDALMALYFGQVDAALVTPSSIDVLKRVNPVAAGALRVLFEFGKLLRPPLCAPMKSMPPAQVDAMTKIMKSMSEDTNGKEVMRRMGFDNWVPFAQDMLKK